jgi:prevent-host-death family protein
MSRHTIAEAGENLAELIDRAIAGEGVVITRNGTPVAELRPVPAPPPPPRVRTSEETEEMLAFLRKDRPIRRNAKEDAGALVSRMRDEDWDR